MGAVSVTRPLPLDAAELSAIAALLDRPLVAVDVGCRGGVHAAWRALGPPALLVGFDADPAECARLNDAAGDSPHECYEPVALAAQTGEAALYVTVDPQCSSLYPPSEDAIRRYPELGSHTALRGTQTIETSTLDAWSKQADAGPIDALKVDVQGAELDVLRGAERSLSSVRVLELEVEFQPLYRGQPLFADVDRFLRACGFSLWRMRELSHCGLSPAGRDEPVFAVGDQVERTRLGGQVAWANAVYVRNEVADADAPATWAVRARDACVAAVFYLPELVELALTQAVKDAPDPARSALSCALASARRRASR